MSQLSIYILVGRDYAYFLMITMDSVIDIVKSQSISLVMSVIISVLSHMNVHLIAHSLIIIGAIWQNVTIHAMMRWNVILSGRISLEIIKLMNAKSGMKAIKSNLTILIIIRETPKIVLIKSVKICASILSVNQKKVISAGWNNVAWTQIVFHSHALDGSISKEEMSGKSTIVPMTSSSTLTSKNYSRISTLQQVITTIPLFNWLVWQQQTRSKKILTRSINS